MNYINLPKVIKNIIGSFLFDEEEHNIIKYKNLVEIHCIADTSSWYKYRGKKMLLYMYNQLKGCNSLKNSINEKYIFIYQNKCEYYEKQQILTEKRPIIIINIYIQSLICNLTLKCQNLLLVIHGKYYIDYGK